MLTQSMASTRPSLAARTRSAAQALALVAAVVLGLCLPAAAAEFDLPGLDSDNTQFMAKLTAPYPAGGTPSGRSQAERRAAAARAKNDWNTVAAALEDRLGQGQGTFDLWRQLAEAETRRTPPDQARALQAAYMAFGTSDKTEDKVAALTLGAAALTAQGRPAQAGTLLRAALDLTPDDTALKQLLADANKAAGLQVQKVTTSEDSDPPRACIAFNLAPSKRNDFHPEDWVRLTPAVPDAAITREGDQVCVSGLPLAATTRASLRAGMPAEGGLAMLKDTTVALTMGNRSAKLVFNDKLFILPRGQAPRITLTSSNVSTVTITVALFTERTLQPWATTNEIGKAFESYQANTINREQVRVVWTGKADIASFRQNALLRTVLPLPVEAMTTPGLYAVSVVPGDGQSKYDAGAVQPVLQTDLAPTVWRGTDGLTIQVRSYSDAKPRSGVGLRLIAKNNDILAEARTDADGMARFPAALLHGEGIMAATAIQGLAEATAQAPADFVSLNLDAAAFDLSDRGVSGAPQPGLLDAFVWTDRGIYRPGETLHLMALLRDNGGAPVQRPAHLKVLRPNGETFQDTVVQPGGGGSLHLPVTLSEGAGAGIWTAQVLGDPKQPPIGSVQFKVDAFIPDRMAVTLGTLPAQLPAGQTIQVPVTARFLYGAPAAHLSGSTTVKVMFAPEPPAPLKGYEVGLVDEAFAPEAISIDLPATDDQGRTTLPLRLGALPDTTHPVQAALDVGIDDPSGHATHIPATVPVRPANPLIGIKRLFKESVDAGEEAGFDVIAIDPDLRRLAMPATLRLVREKPDWRLVNTGTVTSYQTVWRDEPLETHDVTIPADGVLHFARTLDFGRYRIEVAQKSGLAATSIRFRSGWASSDSPDVPDRADVSADRQTYGPGTTARIHVAAPFGGPATLLVLTDHVVSTRSIDVPAGGSDIDVPVDAAWGPGAYVTVHVFRGGTGAGAGTDLRPDRAIGLVWLGVDPAARHLDATFDAPELVRPRLTAHATLRTTPGAWVTVAAVDEGILHLTDYRSPDAAPYLLGRRALGVDIRDDWGRLIAPADGTATLLRQGGDESAGRRPNIPQHIVSMFIGPIQADADGKVDVPLPYPDFNGQVRLMAMVWDGTKVGAASVDMLVRDQLVAEPLLPRYLAPGDTGRMAVLLQNLDLPSGPVTVKVTADGPLSVDGDGIISTTLAQGAQTVPTLTLRAAGAGTGRVRLDVTGPSGFHALHEAMLDVHSARSRDSLVAAAELAPDATTPLSPNTGLFIGGTWRASAVFGQPVRYDVPALLRALEDYPLFCLEQATSKGLPLTVLSEGDAERGRRLQAMVNAVLDRQRYDGSFGLWSSGDEAEPWLSAYATEFLLRARKAGAFVGEAGLKDALHSLTDGLASSGTKPEDYALQAYALYVVALAGEPRAGLNRVLFESLDKLPTPLAKAQLGAALMLGNDAPRAERAFAAALASPARKPWAYDYGNGMRDVAAVTVLLKESGLMPDRLQRMVAVLPGADTKAQALSTQEQAWLATAAGVLGRGGQVTRITLDGRDVPPAPVVTVALDGGTTVHNVGDHAVWQTVSVTGVLARAPAAARAGMHVERKLFGMDGKPVDPARLRQNQVFVLLLQGAAEDGQDHRTQIMQGLPAGWEIAGRLQGGDIAGMPWLGTLTPTEAQPAADDRFLAVVHLTEDQQAFRVAVRLRAVTPGNFDLPGSEASDMYRPGLFARIANTRVDVLPPQ